MSPRRYRAPSPRAAARSALLYRPHDFSDRHPHPMHEVASSRSRCNAAMRSSRTDRQLAARRSQSFLVGVRPSGSVSRASRISGSDKPKLSSRTSKEPPPRRSRRPSTNRSVCSQSASRTLSIVATGPGTITLPTMDSTSPGYGLESQPSSKTEIRPDPRRIAHRQPSPPTTS